MKKEWLKPEIECIEVATTKGPNTRGPKDGNSGKTHPVFPSGKKPKAYEIGL